MSAHEASEGRKIEADALRLLQSVYCHLIQVKQAANCLLDAA
jgi:hypothetical protein